MCVWPTQSLVSNNSPLASPLWPPLLLSWDSDLWIHSPAFPLVTRTALYQPLPVTEVHSQPELKSENCIWRLTCLPEPGCPDPLPGESAVWIEGQAARVKQVHVLAHWQTLTGLLLKGFLKKWTFCCELICWPASWGQEPWLSRCPSCEALPADVAGSQGRQQSQAELAPPSTTDLALASRRRRRAEGAASGWRQRDETSQHPSLFKGLPASIETVHDHIDERAADFRIGGWKVARVYAAQSAPCAPKQMTAAAYPLPDIVYTGKWHHHKSEITIKVTSPQEWHHNNRYDINTTVMLLSNLPPPSPSMTIRNILKKRRCALIACSMFNLTHHLLLSLNVTSPQNRHE